MKIFLTMLVVVLFIGLYAAGAATLGGMLTGLPVWLQIAYYAVAGTVWAFPLKPLMDWMRGPPPSPETDAED